MTIVCLKCKLLIEVDLSQGVTTLKCPSCHNVNSFRPECEALIPQFLVKAQTKNSEAMIK